MATNRATTKTRPASTKKRPAGKRAQNKEAIRKRIVKSALNLFQTKGFATTTTKAIARKAGIAEGTVFNYFRTKEEIALSFFEEEVDHAIAAVRDNPRLRKAPLEEKLFTLVHSQLEYLAPYERFIGAALIHALNPASHLGPFSHRAQQLRHRYLAFVTELVEESTHQSNSMAHCRGWSLKLFGSTTSESCSSGSTIHQKTRNTRSRFSIVRCTSVFRF